MRVGYFATLVAVAVFALRLPAAWAADEPMPTAIAEVGDPPPGITGDIGRLLRVPGWVEVHGAESVAAGADKWKGDADLSGSLVLGWDPANLYVAARVRDSILSQSFSGEAMWQGDHLLVLLDVPRQEGVRDKGKIIQIGISPGNFKPGGLPPEVFQWTPKRASVAGARVGAQKADNGYQIEAAIPWKSLGVDQVARGMRIGYDVGFSDSDQIGEAIQDKVTSLVRGPWDLRSPDRLVEGILASADGRIDSTWIKSAFELIRSGIRVNPQQTVTVGAGKLDTMVVRELIVRARLESSSVTGGNPFLQVRVNSQVMDIDRVRNRLAHFDMGPRQAASTGPGGTWFIFFAPNFKPIPDDSGYAVQGIDPFEFRFDVTDLWKPAGGNVIDIVNTATAEYSLVAEVGVSERQSRKLMPPLLKPAPTGPIPTFVPVTDARPNYTFNQMPGGAIEVKLGAQRWVVESVFSTLTPGWAKLGPKEEHPSEWKSFKKNENGFQAAAHGFELQRTITRHDDHLQVVDRFVNTLAEDLPLMYVHRAQVDRKSGTIYLAGVPITQAKSITSTGEHPATLVTWENSGFAMLSEDDLTRVQACNFAEDDVVGIRNERLVVGKAKAVELEFSIYPLETGEFFDFINRVRRNWDVNFTLQGSLADTHSDSPGMNLGMPDAALKNHLVNKAAMYGIAWVPYFNFPGLGWTDDEPVLRRQKMLDRIRQVQPDFVRLMYYHAFSGFQDPRLQTDANLALLHSLYKVDAILRPDGSQADYSNPRMPLFLPTEGSVWGKASESLLDYRLERSGFEGVFWDEIEYSSVKYDYNPNHWDGVSAEIDPTTHRIVRKITNVTLATQPWRLRLAEKIMKKGALMGNGAPHTRSFTRMHFLRLVETSSIHNLILAQFYTPIQVGDHLTERNEVDCYRNMVRGLDFGGVYYWYRPEIVPTHPTLTSYMFPITPINLGRGFIIGRERILTNHSGFFGWGDASNFKWYVYDRNGKATDGHEVRKVTQSGKTYAEVRLPEGYSVAIVREW
jgi:hypothetical protein